MPNLHDVERRIRSVNSTKQITRTMEMVAAAKIRHSSERFDAAAPYANSMNEMLGSVASQAGGAQSALLEKREDVKRVLVIVVVSDRGLAGGFNSNVLRESERYIKRCNLEGAEVEVVACGKKALGFFKYRHITPVMQFVDLSADPTPEQAAAIAKYAIAGYEGETLDQVVVIYNHCKNAAEQVLRTETVLPVDASAFVKEPAEAAGAGDGVIEAGFEFEPGAAEVLDKLLPAYVRTAFYSALIDSAAGEQAARRAAMKAATDNANEMVETLTRLYNRVRQGAITTEINEIVGGAAALED